MMRPTLNGSTAPAISGRPSLYATTAIPADIADSGSILGGLERGRPRINGRGTLVAAMALLLFGLAGWILTQEVREIGNPVNSLPIVASMKSPEENSAARADTLADVKAPAAIVADVGAQSLPNRPAMAPAAVPEEDFLVWAASRVAHEQSLSPSEELVPAVASAVEVAPAEKPQAAVTPPAAAKVAVAQKNQAMAAVRPSAGNAPAKAGEKDGDVELIAALLHRVSGKPEVPAGDAVRVSRPEEVRRSPVAVAQKKSRKNPGSRDPLGARPAESAQARPDSCNSLGFFEAEMCRLRACTGRWGSDPGCPEYAQNSSVAP